MSALEVALCDRVDELEIEKLDLLRENDRLHDAMKAARVYAGDLPPQQGLVIVDLLERGMRDDER